jgi:chromosome segregation ATPase
MTRVEQEKVQRLRNLTSMNERIKGMEDHLQTCRNDLYQISSDVARREDEKQSMRRNMSQLDHQISNFRCVRCRHKFQLYFSDNETSSLKALRNESGNTLLLYGRDVPRVKQLIEQNKSKFAQVPRGPLGHYIKLRDKKWAVAVESYLSPALLGSFMVDNRDDNQLLVQIMNKAWSGGRKPTIITSKFFHQKHNVHQNLVKAPPDCVGLYDALDIEDPVVANCIVDQAAIEGILLIPNNDRAMQLLSSQANVPKNCRQGVTITGDKYYPDPNYKTYGSRYHRAQYLQVDTKEHIVQLENNIKALKEKKENAQNQFSAFCGEIREQETKKAQLEEKIKKLNTARSQIRRQLDELKATAEPEVANVELLESELKEIRNTLREKRAQFAVAEEALKEIKREINENEEKLRQLKNSNSSLEDRMTSLEAQIREETIRQREIATSAEFDKRKAKEFENKLNQARSELVAKQTTAHQYTEQASSLGDRQDTSRKVPDIVAEMSQLERSVRKIETDTESTDELFDKYQHMHDKFTKLSTIISCLKDDIKELNVAIDRRTRHYKLTENYFVAFIKRSFKKIMEVRQFQVFWS